ncbi:hypothetical protein CLOACE_22460 [Clostridium acetireducens DSM 10703]|uniref:DUF1538 domain-containing protein n=1 Tax=Clostridium acetireducens DSM 10703 TaxID=1121290 RepID=A0A1E8EVB1_9CLOT|nr:DUF1538 domain-containing protein [Clostridium acetireducens]OFH99430.1 hypothetical protein CLOACE_22460 [Clostridium acetireducens DSM 10703]
MKEMVSEFVSTLKSILPITVALFLFKVIVLKSSFNEMKEIFFGILLSIVGLFLFLQGLKHGLMPLGNAVGSELYKVKYPIFIVLIFFCIGYFSTLAEPAVTALAGQVEEVSVGVIKNKVMTHTIAIGAALGMMLGAIKILYKVPAKTVLLPIIALILIFGFFASNSMVAIAFDASGTTTGPVNIPLNLALGIGLSSMLEGSDTLVDGFGLIGLSLLGTILAVLMLGVVTKM